MHKVGFGCGSVGTAVVSDTKDVQREREREREREKYVCNNVTGKGCGNTRESVTQRCKIL